MGRLGQSWGIRRTGEPTTAGATAAAAVAGRTDSHATLTDTDLRTRRFRFGRRHADRLRLRLRLLVNRNRPGGCDQDVSGNGPRICMVGAVRGLANLVSSTCAF